MMVHDTSNDDRLRVAVSTSSSGGSRRCAGTPSRSVRCDGGTSSVVVSSEVQAASERTAMRPGTHHKLRHTHTRTPTDDPPRSPRTTQPNTPGRAHHAAAARVQCLRGDGRKRAARVRPGNDEFDGYALASSVAWLERAHRALLLTRRRGVAPSLPLFSRAPPSAPLPLSLSPSLPLSPSTPPPPSSRSARRTARPAARCARACARVHVCVCVVENGRRMVARARGCPVSQPSPNEQDMG